MVLAAGGDRAEGFVGAGCGTGAAQFDPVAGDQTMVIDRRHGTDRIVQVGPDNIGEMLRQECRNRCAVGFCRDRRRRLIDSPRSALASPTADAGQHRRNHCMLDGGADHGTERLFDVKRARR